MATASHSNYTRLAINKGDIQDDGDAGTVCTTTSTLHPPAIFNRATAETKQLAFASTVCSGKHSREVQCERRCWQHQLRQSFEHQLPEQHLLVRIAALNRPLMTLGRRSGYYVASSLCFVDFRAYNEVSVCPIMSPLKFTPLMLKFTPLK